MAPFHLAYDFPLMTSRAGRAHGGGVRLVGDLQRPLDLLDLPRLLRSPECDHGTHQWLRDCGFQIARRSAEQVRQLEAAIAPVLG